MTIDLGFAWLQLPSGREISIVDVPGHERFIKNMLAGVGGLDAALLVVAADEGIMPQTREHLAILDLLQVRRGIVAVTKCDLVDEEWLELVKEEVGQTLRGASLAGAPLLPVSALTGQGLDALTAALDVLLATAEPKRDLGRPRLPIDRVFTLGGFGTVVTGTLLDGRLALGQELEVVPRGLRTRARGLQSHKTKVDEALPGRRVAVNLGGLAKDDLARGDVVSLPGVLRPTTSLDVKLRLLEDAPRALKHGTLAGIHVGTAEVVGKVSLLDRDALEPGAEGWAQVRLLGPVAVAKNDLFVLRQLSPGVTLGGGQIVDPHPARRHRRRQAAVLEALQTLAQGTPAEIVLQTLRLKEPCDPAVVLGACGLDSAAARAALDELLADGRALRLGANVISAAGWTRLEHQMLEHLARYHRQYPLRVGMPREELKSRLALGSRVFIDGLARAAAAGRVVEAGATVRLAEHTVNYTAVQAAAADRLLALLGAAAQSPPSVPDLKAQVPGLDEELLLSLAEQGKIVRLNEDLAFTADVYRSMVEQIVARLRAQGRITVAEVRDLFGSSRRYALALMEQLDREHVTRRVGDERVLAGR